MGKKPSKEVDQKPELEPWEKEAAALGATGEPDPWENELPKSSMEPGGPYVAPLDHTGRATSEQPVKAKNDSKSITKVPGPKRKFQ